VSPRPLDPEDLRDDAPPDAAPVGFTPAEAHAAATERASILLDAIGRGPVLPCSAPRSIPPTRPRYGWTCDPDGPGCSRLRGRLDFPFHSTEADSARRLDASDFKALAGKPPVRGPALVVTYTSRPVSEAPRLRPDPEPQQFRGGPDDLATALMDLPGVAQRRWLAKEAGEQRRREIGRAGA